MNQLCDDMFHLLEVIRSCAINMFSYNFSNSYNRLFRTLTSCASLFSLGLDGNMYYVGSNGCNPYTSWNGVWPILTL
jgi:hypothetical protein